MKKYNTESELFTSAFVDCVDSIKDINRKCELFRARVISLEKKNRKHKFHQKMGRNPKKGEIDFSVQEEPSKRGKEFYASMQWKRLRYQFLMLSNKQCSLCGSKNKLHVDHIIPRSIDPTIALDPNNLQILCEDCNFGKGNTPDHVILRKKLIPQ